MANIKIAQLTNATTISDTDIVLIEDATQTKKMTVANLKELLGINSANSILATVPKRFIGGFGEYEAANILLSAWAAMGGTGNAYGTFLVTIRDNLLNDFYVGVHDYNHGGWHNWNKVAGGLNVDANAVGTIVATTGAIANRAYVIQLIS